MAILVRYLPDEYLNTSAIERSDLTNRFFCSILRRRSVTFPGSLVTVDLSLQLYEAYYNLCGGHRSLSIPRREDNGKYQPISPAMKLGLTDHIWNLHEVMNFFIE